MGKRRKVIVMMETSRTFGRSIIRGIVRYARSHGDWIFSRKAPFYRPSTDEEVNVDKVRKMDVDGLILREQQSRELTESLLDAGIPAIVSPYTEPFENVPNILTDDVAVGVMAAEHLLHRGFRHFAYCGFGQMYYWSRNRGEGFAARVARDGFETHFYEYERPESKSRQSWDTEQDVMVDWLKALPKPVAMMACNDDRCQYVLEACMIAGIHVPEELAIIGLGNDDLICDLATPPLSSVALSAQKAGFDAAARLDKMMVGKSTPKQGIIVRPTHVVTRQSSDVFAVKDTAVAAALHFIHQRAEKEPIQVDDVLSVVSMSRRSLYERFAKALGRSVHEEIKRVRVDRFARLLVTTDMPITQISESLGYSDIKNISRYFKQEKGVSPSQYRKEHSLK